MAIHTRAINSCCYLDDAQRISLHQSLGSLSIYLHEPDILIAVSLHSIFDPDEPKSPGSPQSP
jgi:hypothetical protein